MGEGGWRLERRWKGKLEGWKGGVNKRGECGEEGRVERVDGGNCMVFEGDEQSAVQTEQGEPEKTNQNCDNVNAARRVETRVNKRILDSRVRELALSSVSNHNAETQNGRNIQSWPALPRCSSEPSARSWRDAKWEPGGEVG
jgi:hypothetical protein